MPFCHNCGTQLGEAIKFCPSCGAAYQGDQSSSGQTFQTALIPAAPTPQSKTFQSAPANPIQQNVVIMGKQKSVGIAFLLAFLFGPLGLLYASILGGIVMFFITFLFFFLLPFIGPIFCWVGCIIWAVVAAGRANKSMMNKGNALINKQFQQ
jgi:hypothetical protein